MTNQLTALIFIFILIKISGLLFYVDMKPQKIILPHVSFDKLQGGVCFFDHFASFLMVFVTFAQSSINFFQPELLGEYSMKRREIIRNDVMLCFEIRFVGQIK